MIDNTAARASRYAACRNLAPTLDTGLSAMDSLITWFNNLPVPSQATLIAAIVGAVTGLVGTVAAGILRDFVARWWTDQRDSQRNSEEIYRRYAEPLSAAASSLMWRLHELFGNDGRANFLLAGEPRTAFEDYKLRSTYYRLAVLLGWVRALRIELSFLRTAGKHRIEKIEDAIANIEKALADGHHVEIKRLHGLRALWSLNDVPLSDVITRLAVEVEIHVKTTLQKSSVTSAIHLAPELQTILCRETAQLVCQKLNAAPIMDDVIAETRARAIRQIAIEEAWLYRDWQAAIGDMMLKPSTNATRRFDMMGFGEFESMVLAPNKDQFRSLCRIAALFQMVNLSTHDPFDARPEMLDSLYRSTSRLVVAIAEVPVTASLLSRSTVTTARDIAQKRARASV